MTIPGTPTRGGGCPSPSPACQPQQEGDVTTSTTHPQAHTPGPPPRRRTPGHDTSTGDAAPPGTTASTGKYDLSDDDREWVDQTVASLGTLTDRQRDILGVLLRQRR